MTFPAHQGLILPLARRWPNSFDALALSVGAAMPDITDTLLGFPLNGYFKQWYGHSLIGIFTLDLVIGLFIAWLITVLAGRLQAFLPKAPRTSALMGGRSIVLPGRNRLSLWSFSVFVGILSHIGFDLISHDTNLLLYPWYENVHWFPKWWYTIWFEFRPLYVFDKRYFVGVYTVSWMMLTLLGIFLFLRFLSQSRVQLQENMEQIEGNPEQLIHEVKLPDIVG
jgi:hypothetical protein